MQKNGHFCGISKIERNNMNTILGRQSFYQSCQKPEVHRPFDAPPNYICIQNAHFFLIENFKEMIYKL
jgi:hypothetical protein